ncbi:hypothetical protein, partial [Mesorhizobium sp. WSM4884]|uniref:hypothetical protein n=1 Tax=Mesorhizobium sp. WSM4884 TaxID=3038542 RepID=UPI0024170987
AIDGALSVTLTERTPGEFHGILQGDALETHLRAYLGSVVYLVIQVGADFLGHYPVRVVDGVPLGS